MPLLSCAGTSMSWCRGIGKVGYFAYDSVPQFASYSGLERYCVEWY